MRNGTRTVRNLRWMVLLLAVMTVAATLLPGNMPATNAQEPDEGTATIGNDSAWEPLVFPRDKVEPELQQRVQSNPQAQEQYLVYLSEQADLSAAARIGDWHERGEFVYDTLWETAQRSQQNVQRFLQNQVQSHDVAEYESFYIVNAILVTGNLRTLDRLAQRDDVAYIEAVSQFAIPDPIRSEDNTIAAIEWGVSQIHADDVWSSFGITGDGIVVANIDTGVWSGHPALIDQYRGTSTGSHDYNWFDPTGTFFSSPGDDDGHGTHVMGTMIGDDGSANQIGVAPSAQWIAAKGCGLSYCTGYDLLASAEWVLAPYPIGGSSADGDSDQRPHVVNNSWGGGSGDMWYQGVVQAWRAASIFPAFSAGNEGSDAGSITSPADYAESFAVGATDSSDTIAWFSSRGPSSVTDETKPNVSAPGVSIRSASPSGGYAYMSGTSMASPHVAGCVALIRSANPNLNVTQVEDILMDTSIDLGDGGPDDDYGHGRIDCYQAVGEVQDGLFVSSITPTYGPVSGGTLVTLNGGGFETGATVTLGDSTCSDVDVVSEEELTCITGAHPIGTVDVVLENDAGESVILGDGYTYLPESVTLPWSDDMESGVQWIADGLWHLVNDSFSPYPNSHSPTHSWWYGQDSTGDYDTGTANSGSLTSPPIIIPSEATGAALTFWYWYETEDTYGIWDQRHIMVSVDGGPFESVRQLSGDSMNAWHEETIDLADYAGSTIQIRFYFTTIDAEVNAYRGWYIDDVQINAPASVSMPDLLTPPATTIQVPITAQNLTDLVAADMVVTFDPAVLEVQQVLPGTLTTDWMITDNTSIPGAVAISMISTTTPVNGDGTLALLEVAVQDAAGASSPLHFESVSFNEDTLPVQAQDGSITVSVGISGTVRFWNGGLPISGATLELTGGLTDTVVSDLTGVYSFTNLMPGEAYSVTVAHEATSAVNGITADDASLVLRYVNGSIDLSSDAQVAADVNQSGGISALDAYYILQKATGIISLPFPGADTIWEFVPPGLMFPLLTSNEIDQDFVGVLIGDVSGNWSPLGPQQQRSNVPADAPAHIRIEQTPADAQGIATATLVMDEVDEAVSSLDLVLTYDADQVEAVDVEPGASATGFDMVSNLANAGEVRVALATAAPTTNGGTLLHLRLHMQESATEPALDLAQVLINEVRVTAAAPASQVHAATPVPVYLPLVQR